MDRFSMFFVQEHITNEYMEHYTGIVGARSARHVWESNVSVTFGKLRVVSARTGLRRVAAIITWILAFPLVETGSKFHKLGVPLIVSL